MYIELRPANWLSFTSSTPAKLAKRAGIEVNVWTLNEVSEWDSAVRMGVDGIVTDDPVGLTAYLDKLRLQTPPKHLGKPRASRACT
ncbi:MAG: hypothetical protein IT342_22395 [Candidatus Melainabacteria bacterium]|nr:hypothetical protein [Candidatus Melainabacteria bacterium]